ncbi:1,5-anhydro-D-fructose reductase-like [Oppia nitens]|uniref:1,5-anhydro-D-fructose reductase-like n=1 Tax=Oppia nitens TaxID=1686743 RepID=UPI0023DC9D45|nr:1,5-anhydro-D-fructose reductase-like [Oppia nitens]
MTFRFYFIIVCIINLYYLISAEEKQIAPLPKHVLPSGRVLPPIGFGTFGWGTHLNGLTSYLSAIDNGYRLIDTCSFYDNKLTIGLAVKQQIAAKLITRKDVFIISKIWNTFHKSQSVVENIREDLKELGFDRIDAGLLHYPTSFQPGINKTPKFENGSYVPMFWEKDKGYLEAYRGLEAAFLLGLIGSIGLSNVNVHQINKILENAYIRPVILEIECHPFYKNEKLINFGKQNNMSVICYAPLRGGSQELKNNPVLKEIASKHNQNVQQVALRWNMQRGTIVIPRSHNKIHQLENIKSQNFVLDENDMDKINNLPDLKKLMNISGLQTHPDYPFGPGYDTEP